jgi:hypothetical protein
VMVSTAFSALSGLPWSVCMYDLVYPHEKVNQGKQPRLTILQTPTISSGKSPRVSTITNRKVPADRMTLSIEILRDAPAHACVLWRRTKE